MYSVTPNTIFDEKTYKRFFTEKENGIMVIINREQLYKALNMIVDGELSRVKPDMTIIDGCNRELSDLEQGRFTPDPKRKAEAIGKILKEYREKYSED